MWHESAGVRHHSYRPQPAISQTAAAVLGPNWPLQLVQCVSEILVQLRAGSLATALVAFVRGPVLHVTAPLPTMWGASLAALLLVGPPLFFLGQVSPSLVRA